MGQIREWASDSESEREEASRIRSPGRSRLLLLLSLSNLPLLFFCVTRSLFHLLLLFSPRLFFLISHSSPNCPHLHRISQSFSSSLCCSLQSEDRLIASGCCRGGRARKSLMRCLSPPSRLDLLFSAKNHNHHTALHHELHPVRLPTCSCCSGHTERKGCWKLYD